MHRIAPLAFAGTPQEALNALIQTISALPGSTIIQHTPRYVAAEFRSRVFQFIDDLECFLFESQGIIHVKSASRIGLTDFGVNRRRVELIRKIFHQWEVVKGNGTNR